MQRIQITGYPGTAAAATTAASSTGRFSTSTSAATSAGYGNDLTHRLSARFYPRLIRNNTANIKLPGKYLHIGDNSAGDVEQVLHQYFPPMAVAVNSPLPPGAVPMVR